MSIAVIALSHVAGLQEQGAPEAGSACSAAAAAVPFGCPRVFLHTLLSHSPARPFPPHCCSWVWTFLVYFGVGLHTSCRLLSFWGVMMATNFFRCQGGALPQGTAGLATERYTAQVGAKRHCPTLPIEAACYRTPLPQLHSGPGAGSGDPPPGSHHGHPREL